MTEQQTKLDLAVCILFFEKVGQTIECVDSFWRPEIKIYILNNNSSAKNRDILGQHCDKYSNVVIFDSLQNLGVAGGRNFLIAQTKEPWLLFVDSDIVSGTKNWLEKFEKHLKRESQIEVFIPKLYNSLEKKNSIYSGFYITGEKVRRKANIFKNKINSFPGGASLISSKLFQRLGNYDEAMFVGFEDFELAFRAILIGSPVVAQKIKDITFIHNHKAALSLEDKKAVLARYASVQHAASLERIKQKHGLVFEEEYTDWLKSQIEVLACGKKYQKKLRDYFLVKALLFVAQRCRQFFAKSPKQNLGLKIEKKKILYIITQSQWGGAQRYVFDLAVGFQAEFEVSVACGGDGRLLEELEKNKIKVFKLKNLEREIDAKKDWLAFWEIFKLVKMERPDVVHTNSSKAEILGNLAARLAGTKRIIFTAHGFAFNEELKFFKKQFYVFWERFANLFSDRIICVSHFDLASGLKNKVAKKEKMTVIHNGIEIKEQVLVLSKEKEKIIIGSVANLYKNKGLEYFIRAVAILKVEKLNNLEFQVVGQGQERKFLETEIKRLSLDNFKLLGFQAEPEKYLQQLDIFVLPSLKEGFPYAILEAMSNSLPIVATRVGGIPEAIVDGKNGFLVESKNPQQLAEKIKSLVNDPQLRQTFGKRGREIVEKEFPLAGMLEETKKLLV